ncbi:MAG: hypothetical protein P4L55_12925 [Syntrophobacteraceae bacterium]|nr:hypothetical protein [Syntrophobacteraceae bacterium]
MNQNWLRLILDSRSPEAAWKEIFAVLLNVAEQTSSPVALHEATVVPDRLLSEAAWELWEAYPNYSARTSEVLKEWAANSSPKAILILDALSLRELPFLLGGARTRGIKPVQVKVTGSECPSTTDQFAHALGLQSRSALANDSKPGAFALFGAACYTDVIALPFEDCAIPPSPNVVIWHSWLDDLIHVHKKLPDQIATIASAILQSDGFWGFIDKLRQGRKLVITSDHGYAVSKRFSSQVEDHEAIAILRETFGASRSKAASEPLKESFMPPIVMAVKGRNVVMGQRKWNVQGAFPDICHGGMSLLEVAVPWVELPSL